MKVTMDGDDGVQRTFDESEVMVIDLRGRARDIVALEEIMRVLEGVSIEEGQRILTFALNVVGGKKP